MQGGACILHLSCYLNSSSLGWEQARGADAGAQEVLGDREVADQAGWNSAAARLDPACLVEQQHRLSGPRKLAGRGGPGRSSADDHRIEQLVLTAHQLGLLGRRAR
mgnify:CR=1 FL=1